MMIKPPNWMRLNKTSSEIIDRSETLSIEFDDWHFNLRKSNTEPLIRLNLEAQSHKKMAKKRREIIKMIRS